MNTPPVPKYAQLSLHQLADALNIDFYNVLTALCHTATGKLETLKELDINNVLSGYANACTALLQQLKLSMADRQQALVPYLQTLHEKEATNHNCANCTGSCDMQHMAHLATLKDSHIQVTTMLQALQTVQLPAMQNAPYHNLLQSLANEMKLVDNVICELIAVESEHLLPSIISSQKSININAGS